MTLPLHFSLPQRVTGCILSNVNTPSMTPVIGQPQNETPQPIYQNNNVPTKPTAGRGTLVWSSGSQTSESPGGLVKTQLPGAAPGSDSVGLGWGGEFAFLTR